ncbi:thioredoxin family protein [Nocardia brasiliensis]|uniref:Alkyl hydroperoxide reductase/ Thiol specific antioxidant/ Mal allergen n=1 Tax=Nocardia brasiliensis (strain ATCC 700358 / HUJEG-1) TaxID=1133849 RepID=K0F5X9_NOCB7|nr:thioredoxin family protein [Nocardia brasiliensis]AFU04730.1 alkyl hydroperoxide reductase/ Thiol specific antioxidant/ Mal allergen [Nocardia brasiliensis ATCC 700358]OCF88296.1 alkyl hydroperoxide reductase [Nocardia brasiliensis]
MALASFMVPLGTPAPDFALPDLDQRVHSRADFAGGPGLLVVFASNHCPYVKHVESMLGEVVDSLPMPAVAICSNDAGISPDDAPIGLRDQAIRAGWTFPYLIDETQQVGRAFRAACTPDFFLYDANLALAYRGALDESTPGNGKPVTGKELRSAIETVLDGAPVPEPHRPSMGCSIKWRES